MSSVRGIFYNLVFVSNCLLLTACGSGGASSDSTSSTSTFDSDNALIINEVVAAAVDGGSDWIEFYANQDIADASLYSIVDDNTDHVAQSLPSVSLSTGDYLIVQAIDADDEATTEGYYVTFKLGGDDAVTLFESGSEIQTLDWEEGDATEGYSYGFYNEISQTLAPTPGAENSLSADESTTDTTTTTDETTATAPIDTTINEDASLRINEIVAKSADGGEDWIEFYVTGSSAVNLSDYTLADEDFVIAALPDVSLQSGEFYRVYATDETLTDQSTVALKFGASDEAHLYLGDDLVDSLSWKKGDALIGYSYGRFPDGGDGTQTLTPTAGATNVVAELGALLISEVMASDANGGADWFELYNNSTVAINLNQYSVIDSSDDIDPIGLPDVTISAGEYVVIYATDEDPGSSYVSFKLGKEDELSLLLDDETVDYIDWDESDVITGYSYGLNPDTLASYDFLTPTPATENVLASAFDNTQVNSLYINISSENWASILADPTAEEYHETSITLNDVTLESVAIRTKGGSSLSAVAADANSDRYSFKIDINEYVSGQKFFGLKKFTLQNSYNDPTYMRETLAYELLAELGVATPENSYVNVYLNNELFGLYLMVEAIDGEFIEDHFSNANGDLYKPDGEGSTLEYAGSDISAYSEINLQNNDDTTDNGAFLNFVAAMDSGATDVIDVDSLLRYMAVSVALSNLDSYFGTLAHNYYIYDDNGVFSLLPWDFNESFGSFNMDCEQSDIRELYIDEPTSGALSERPLIANVFADSNNLETYHDYLWQLIEGSLETNTFSARVNEIADLIRDDVENDPSAFYSINEFEENLTSAVGQFYGLTSFMEYRVANMTQQLQGSIASAGDGSGFCGSSTEDDRPPR